MYSAPASRRAIVRSSNAMLLQQGAHVGAPSTELDECVERIAGERATHFVIRKKG